MRDLRNSANGAGFAVFAAIVATSTPGEAQEYCVACTGPNALYRCVLEQAKPSGIPLKSLCVRTLAREGRHVSCSVRAGTVFDCDAPIKKIDALSAAEKLRSPAPPTLPTTRGPVPAPPPTMVVKPGAPSQPRRAEPAQPRPADRPAPPEVEKRPNDHPETVEALAKSISRSSENSLDKAGNAITRTTRKTWNCLASFFKSC